MLLLTHVSDTPRKPSLLRNCSPNAGFLSPDWSAPAGPLSTNSRSVKVDGRSDKVKNKNAPSEPSASASVAPSIQGSENESNDRQRARDTRLLNHLGMLFERAATASPAIERGRSIKRKPLPLSLASPQTKRKRRRSVGSPDIEGELASSNTFQSSRP